MQKELFKYKNIKQHFPVYTMFTIIGIWLLLALANYLSIKHWHYFGTDWLFPFSVLYPSDFLPLGFVYTCIFGILGVIFWNSLAKSSYTQVILFCISLVFVGNMMQGSFDNAFLKPFYWKGQQYYSDAVQITNPSDFIRTFHQKQNSYLLHTRTHPPFVVLFHYYLLQISGGSIVFLSLVFTFLSMLIFPIMKKVWQNFGFESQYIKNLLLLFAVIPSVNIYSLVSLDGLILVSTSLSLLAISEVYRKQKIGVKEVVITALSIIISNSLSFSGLFVIAFLGLLALIYMLKNDMRWAWLVGTSLFISVMVFIVFYLLWGYNHWEVFRTASESENPNGFTLISLPKIYFGTRLQAIGEILVFLSFPFVTIWFSKAYRNGFLKQEMSKNIALSAIFVLLLMFSTGAYGTGETARACLFIVPFIFILIRKIPIPTFNIVYFLCLLQTLVMQTVGNFFW